MRKTHTGKKICIALILACIAWGLTGCTLEQTAQPIPTATPTAAPTNAPTAVPTTKAKLVIDPNIGNTPTPAPTAPGIAIPGWAAIQLPANTLEAEVALYNPEENADWYYLTFELRLQDTDEVIFTTGLVPPGLYCTKVMLTRKLDPGEYEANMYVQPYRMNEAQTPTNNAVANTKLIVR